MNNDQITTKDCPILHYDLNSDVDYVKLVYMLLKSGLFYDCRCKFRKPSPNIAHWGPAYTENSKITYKHFVNANIKHGAVGLYFTCTVNKNKDFLILTKTGSMCSIGICFLKERVNYKRCADYIMRKVFKKFNSIESSF